MLLEITVKHEEKTSYIGFVNSPPYFAMAGALPMAGPTAFSWLMLQNSVKSLVAALAH